MSGNKISEIQKVKYSERKDFAMKKQTSTAFDKNLEGCLSLS